MSQHHAGPRSFELQPVRRRPLLAALGGAGLTLGMRQAALLSRTAAARSQATPPAGEAGPPRGLTFVGPTSDPDALVAIVLAVDNPEEAFGYLCGGPQYNLWFTGTRDGDALALSGPVPSDASPEPGLTLAEAAPTLTGTLSSDGEGVTGEIALPDLTLTFTAIPAEGAAGLFAAERDAAGQVRGTSSTGATLTARQATATTGEAPFRINGTIVGPDGSHFEFSAPAWTDDAAAVRWVVLADGDVQGGRRRRRDSDGDGDDFIDKTIF